VEYRIDGIIQIPVHEELGLTFDAILRRLFRQDPDVIMVGEIRDAETAELSVRAALTGHLVFATLHTNDAAEAVYRLQNMGIPAYMAAATLRAVIAQRLIRKRCLFCGGKGCGKCSLTGYQGRTVISEIIFITAKIAEYIGEGIHAEPLRQALKENHFKTMFDDAKGKAAAGITTDDEVKRELGTPL
jgi:type II secretory ATPase GspE/PulE/Tfp pilus assembly ATPase PilB-like protein